MDRAAAELVERVRGWALAQPDVSGLLLVGSQARGTAGRSSDIDLVVLSSNPQQRRRQVRWVRHLFASPLRLCSWYDRDYGAVWSRHVRLRGLPTVELTFARLDWASTAPLDAGTAGVLRGGYQLMVDRDGLLRQVCALI
jgi:uncharacterized protein